jgi:hypothetical protein
MLSFEEVLPPFTYEGDAVINIRLVLDNGDATTCSNTKSNQAICGIQMYQS